MQLLLFPCYILFSIMHKKDITYIKCTVYIVLYVIIDKFFQKLLFYKTATDKDFRFVQLRCKIIENNRKQLLSYSSRSQLLVFVACFRSHTILSNVNSITVVIAVFLFILFLQDNIIYLFLLLIFICYLINIGERNIIKYL